MDALRWGFRRFPALVGGVRSCTFDAAVGMVAVFLRVPVSLAPFALHYLLFDLRWFEFYDGVH